jgi:MFS family permease
MPIGVWVLAIGLLDFSLEQAIVVPALSAIERRYHASATAVAWILTGFLLALAVSTPLAGRLGDRHGKRLVLMGSLSLFTIGSIVCAVGDSIGMLIAGRVIQGLGGGVGPLAVALVRDNLPRDRVQHAVGVLVGLAGAGGVVGFLACGLLIKYLSVPSIFWLLTAIGAACLLSTWVTVSETPVRARARVDWLGATLLGAALAGFLLAISEGNSWHWGSAKVLLIFFGSAVALCAFVLRELTVPSPLIDPRALRSRPVASANVAVFAVGYALLVGYTLVPLFSQLPKSTGYGLGLSTIQLSLALAPSAAGGFIGGLVSGRIVSRSGSRIAALAGAACGLAAYAALIGFSRTVLAVVLIMTPIGFASGLAIAAITDLLVLSAPQEQTGVVVGVNSVVRAVGSALAAQIAVAIWTAAPKLAPGLPAESGISNAFVMGLCATAVAVLAVISIPRRSVDPVLQAVGKPPPATTAAATARPAVEA